MRPPPRIEEGALARIERARAQILHSCNSFREGNPLAAERDTARLLGRLQTKNQCTREEARALATGIRARADVLGGRETKGAAAPVAPERLQGKTIDFVGVAFFEEGRRAARAVARIATRDGQPIGTGFLVSDRLLLTNNHVIGSPAEAAPFVAEFDYELDGAGRPKGTTRFEFDPTTFFVTDGQDDLDYTLTALGKRLSGASALKDFGWLPLSDAPDKHALGEVANIIQHPDGRFKEVVLRENRLVSRLETVLHYDADTEPGASGSPVFNNEWLVIALHHWGGAWRQRVDEQGGPASSEINEGIRASAIAAELRLKAAGLAPAARALLDTVVRLGEARRGAAPDGREEQAPAHMEADGRVTWRVPLEISVRLPGYDGAPPVPAAADLAVMAAPLHAPERKIHVDKDYENRRGYNPRFISGHEIELPKLSERMKQVAARNRAAGPGDDPLVLPYEHFSVVLDRERKLAFFTACNIDGPSSKIIHRKTGAISSREPGSGGDEALSEGAEASEAWFHDERLDRDDVTNQDLYASQEVPGYDRGTNAWLNRMFQRGHLVRRLDPVWGKDKSALRAEADTFHFTNCTPQLGFFNMGTAPKDKPHTGGGLLWRAIEDYVLDNAADEQKRVCVFTGPVLAEDDPEWRADVVAGFRVPMRFWKIVAWAAGGKLHATAMIADQRPVLTKLPERAEVYADVSRVADFLSTVAEIESLTGLDFGDALRRADINRGGGESKGETRSRIVRSFEEILGPAEAARSGGSRLDGKDRIGDLLEAEGLLTAEVVRSLVVEQDRTPKGRRRERFGDLAVLKGLIKEEDRDRALEQQKKLRGT